MRYTFLIIFSLLFLFFSNISAFDQPEREIYVLFLDIEGPENQEKTEQIFKEMAASVGLCIQKEGLRLSDLNRECRNTAIFSRMKFFGKTGGGSQTEGKIMGAVQGNVYKNGLSENGSFFVIEQDRLVNVALFEEDKEFFGLLQFGLEQQMNEVHRHSISEEGPLLFLHLTPICPPI